METQQPDNRVFEVINGLTYEEVCRFAYLEMCDCKGRCADYQPIRIFAKSQSRTGLERFRARYGEDWRA